MVSGGRTDKSVFNIYPECYHSHTEFQPRPIPRPIIVLSINFFCLSILPKQCKVLLSKQYHITKSANPRSQQPEDMPGAVKKTSVMRDEAIKTAS